MLEATATKVAEERSSRKQPLSDAEARALLASVEEVLVARGKKIERKAAKQARLVDLKGPSGNYRAPLVRRGKTLLVGFHADSLAELLGR